MFIETQGWKVINTHTTADFAFISKPKAFFVVISPSTSVVSSCIGLATMFTFGEFFGDSSAGEGTFGANSTYGEKSHEKSPQKSLNIYIDFSVCYTK